MKKKLNEVKINYNELMEIARSSVPNFYEISDEKLEEIVLDILKNSNHILGKSVEDKVNRIILEDVL